MHAKRYLGGVQSEGEGRGRGRGGGGGGGKVNEQRANKQTNGKFEIGAFDGFLDACFLSLPILWTLVISIHS